MMRVACGLLVADRCVLVAACGLLCGVTYDVFVVRGMMLVVCCLL